MPGIRRLFSLDRTLALVALLLGLLGCSASQPPTRPATARAVNPPPTTTRFTPPNVTPVPAQLMLGIDVLESTGFAAVKGKRLGLLTHPAGVNRNGISTIDVLLRSRQSKLVALFGPEHGIYGNEKAEVLIPNRTDPRTGLPVYSLYGKNRRPTKEMLQGLHAMVIDLQDVGTRSYTYVSAMKWTMEACFQHNVEVIVLDRPNPLGGIKVSGPLLDAKYSTNNYVGAFRVPYVHGLTIAELARIAKELPGVLAIPETARANGRLTVVPMRGWRRNMRWPETGLQWIPTSPMVQDFSAVIGYAMVGLGTYLDPRVGFDIGFRHGVGNHYAFRGLSHKTVKSDVLERELRQLDIPGIGFRRVSVPGRDGKPATGVFVEVNDWDDWDPTALSFHLMVMGCRFDRKNPFAVTDTAASGFLRHMGSEEFFRTLQRNGAQTNVTAWIAEWQRRGQNYRKASQRYWLYQ